AAEYEAAIAIDPNRPAAHAGLVAALVELGHYEQADRAASRARQLFPDEPHVHFATGLVLYHAGDYDGASDAVRRAIERDPDHIEARRRLAWLDAPTGDLDTAVEQGNEIARRLPLDGNCRHNLLMVMNYLPESTNEQVYQAHRDWAPTFAD